MSMKYFYCDDTILKIECYFMLCLTLFSTKLQSVIHSSTKKMIRLREIQYETSTIVRNMKNISSEQCEYHTLVRNTVVAMINDVDVMVLIRQWQQVLQTQIILFSIHNVVVNMETLDSAEFHSDFIQVVSRMHLSCI